MVCDSTYVPGTTNRHYCYTKCVSWTAIIVGALVGLGLGFLLNLFSVSIGLSAMNTTPTGVRTIAIGGFIGLLIASIVSTFVSGWVAGYLGKRYCYNRHLGVLYGFATWCLALILMVTFASHLVRFVGMSAHVMPNRGAMMSMGYDRNAMTQDNTNTNQNTASSNAAQNPVDAAANMPQDQKIMARNLGVSLFLTFILLIIGAISSCFGGYVGLKPCPGDVEEVNRTNTDRTNTMNRM